MGHFFHFEKRKIDFGVLGSLDLGRDMGHRWDVFIVLMHIELGGGSSNLFVESYVSKKASWTYWDVIQ